MRSYRQNALGHPEDDFVRFDYVFVPQEDYEEYRPQKFADVMKGFKEYK